MPSDETLIQSLRDALERTPDALPLRKHLADLLMENGAFQQATQEYRRALDLAPGDAQIKLGLARAYYHQDKVDVALVILEELLRAPDPLAEVYLWAARAYMQRASFEQAARAYRDAVAKDAALADPALERQLTVKPMDSESTSDAKDERVFVVAEESNSSTTGLIEHPDISFRDVGGMDKLKEEIRMKIIYPLTHPDIYQAYGKTMGGGILMYGPPGCGKTYLARATAGEVRAQFLSIGLHDVLDMYLGQSEQNLHAIFELARSHVPCVLFFDEVDALGASRSDLRHSAARQVINQFLSELDGVSTSNEGVLVLAATNAPWHLDAALRRPGRFDRVLFVPPPDNQARVVILQILLAGKPVEKLDYARLARETDGFSGADLKGVVDVAVEHKLREAMVNGIPAPLTMKDLLAVIKTAHATTSEWFATARNYAIYANQAGLYDDILAYLKRSKSSGFFSR